MAISGRFWRNRLLVLVANCAPEGGEVEVEVDVEVEVVAVVVVVVVDVLLGA